MTSDGREVANYILDYGEKNGISFSNLSLQKLVFFCHVWSLVELRRPLVRHGFEAWEYGPVLPYLYREFKRFGADRIVGRSLKLDPLTGERIVVEYSFDSVTSELLNDIVGFYSKLGAGQLVDLSHVEGGPWDQVWRNSGAVNPGMKISDDSILKFYSRVQEPFTKQ